MNNDEIIIRKFDEGDSYEELTGLLHRAYKKLADMGLKFVATYQSVENTKKHLEKGDCYLAFKDGKMIGTIFYYKHMWRDAPPFYKKETVGLFGKFAVEPALQGTGIGSRMLNFVEDCARKDGKKELALDTSEKALHLVEYYKKKGYKFAQYWQWSATNYRSIIMAKTL
jgi:GNAT superfamily N-acetyltransferase